MSDINLEMGKKRSRQQQSSNVAVAAADSSESGDGATDKFAANKQSCSHVTKSVDGNQIKKNISLYINGKKLCPHCKEANEEDNNKSVEEDYWVCLRCGAKTCSIEHSTSHYDVPRSDSHALTLKIPAFSVWCHACKADIPSGCNKKLKTCISSIEQLYNKQINLQPLSQQECKNGLKNTEEVDETKGNKPNEPIPLPAPKKAPVVAPPAVRGLTNLGNTCFFNSVLQCLAQTPGLVEAICEMEKPDQHVDIVLKSGATLVGKLGQWDNLSECLVDTLIKLKSGGPVVSPDRLHSLLTKKQTQFQGYRQHDAHELFTYLIDSVRMTDQKRYRKLILTEFGLDEKTERQNVPEETTKKLKALDHEVAESVTFAPEKVFKGRLVNRIECQECRSVKTFEESFMDLSLPIVPDKPQPPCMRRKGGHQQNQAQAETVQEDNKNTGTVNKAQANMSKSQLKKERRLQRKKNREQGKNSCGIEQKKEEDGESPPVLVEDRVVQENFKDNEEQKDSDVEGDIEDNSEETNCGNKSNATKDATVGEPVENGDVRIAADDVNCGNQGVWLESNECSNSAVGSGGGTSTAADREISEKQEGTVDNTTTNSCQRQEQESLIADLLGDIQDTTNIKETCNFNLDLDNKESIKVENEEVDDLKLTPPTASSTLYLDDNNLDGEGKSVVCSSNQQRRDCDAQVTAWLNTNLMSTPEGDELLVAPSREMSPPIININKTDVSGGHNSRLSPHTHISLCSSNQRGSLPSLDETRSSSLLRTATQETQESGYCSEKLGCAESPQREDSPCSLDGFSAPSSGVEGALSSRSDVSIGEVLNNTTTAIAEEDESTETAEVATAANEVPPSADLWNHKSSWQRGCRCPSPIRKRPPPPRSLLAVQNPSSSSFNQEIATGSNKSPSLMCTRCTDESITKPSVYNENKMHTQIGFEGKTIVEDDEEEEEKVNNHHDLFERNLEDIPEFEVPTNTFDDVVYGPLNKDQLVLGDLIESDNSNDLSSAAQGLIARPGSPCDETNETTDLKNLEINTLNEEDNPLPVYNKTEHIGDQLQDGQNSCCVTTEDVQSVANAAGGDKEADNTSCGCYKVSSKPDSADSCCLHTSLAQSTQAELMTGCNKIACDNCSLGNPDGKSVYTNSTKQTLISHAPPALVIHLKRFQVQMMTCRKLCRHVSFPLQLDLTPYSVSNVQLNTGGAKKTDGNNNKSELLYTLYGLVEHSGTMNGGHYVAYVKISRESSNLWYCISDSHVSLVSEARVLSAQAYLLFYKRINNMNTNNSNNSITTTNTTPST